MWWTMRSRSQPFSSISFNQSLKIFHALRKLDQTITENAMYRKRRELNLACSVTNTEIRTTLKKVSNLFDCFSICSRQTLFYNGERGFHSQTWIALIYENLKDMEKSFAEFDWSTVESLLGLGFVVLANIWGISWTVIVITENLRLASSSNFKVRRETINFWYLNLARPLYIMYVL